MEWGQALGLQRTSLSNCEPAVQKTTAEVEGGGTGRLDSQVCAHRFEGQSWDKTDNPQRVQEKFREEKKKREFNPNPIENPLAIFKRSTANKVIGIDILSKNRWFVDQFIQRNTLNSFKLSGIELERDWRKQSHKECLKLMLYVEGGDALRRDLNQLPGPQEYVVTEDNLIKLLSIQQRLKYKLPVVLMGETGCGKTALVKFLAKTLEYPLRTLHVHGGITDEIIYNFVLQSIEDSKTQNGILIFFDEINAANCMTMFKSLIIDRCMGNVRLPDNIQVISCCKPYQLRAEVEDEDFESVFQHASSQDVATGIKDPMKNLAYRVHPLPESLIDVVYVIGSLNERDEFLYIGAILCKELPNDSTDEAETTTYDTLQTTIRSLLCASQSFVREVNGEERSVASMRDVDRAVKVFKWFLTYHSQLSGEGQAQRSTDEDEVMKLKCEESMKPNLRIAVVLMLGYFYHAKLNRNARQGYCERICSILKDVSDRDPTCTWLSALSGEELLQMIEDTQQRYRPSYGTRHAPDQCSLGI